MKKILLSATLVLTLISQSFAEGVLKQGTQNFTWTNPAHTQGTLVFSINTGANYIFLDEAEQTIQVRVEGIVYEAHYHVISSTPQVAVFGLEDMNEMEAGLGRLPE